MLKSSGITQKRRDFLLLTQTTSCILGPQALAQNRFTPRALKLAQESGKPCHGVGEAKGGLDLLVPPAPVEAHALAHHLRLLVAPLAVTEVGVAPVGGRDNRVPDSRRVDRVDLHGEVETVLGEEREEGWGRRRKRRGAKF